MERPTVHIVEVGPRDGLQAIEQTIPTEVKIELIRRLTTTGLRSIEVTSFTSSQWIPQLADHEKVMEAVCQTMEPSITYPVLVPNLKGFLAAVKAGAKKLVFSSRRVRDSVRRIITVALLKHLHERNRSQTKL